VNRYEELPGIVDNKQVALIRLEHRSPMLTQINDGVGVCRRNKRLVERKQVNTDAFYAKVPALERVLNLKHRIPVDARLHLVEKAFVISVDLKVM